MKQRHKPASVRKPNLYCAGALAALASLGIAALACPMVAQADTYGTEQYAGQAWNYESTATNAAHQAGFSADARASIGWTAGILNGYASDEKWWASDYRKDAARRLAAKGTGTLLRSVRFDNIRTASQAEARWRRVTSGALNGLLDARDKNDVAAAHNILGVALYAAQSFFIHTNWIQDAGRAKHTYYQANARERADIPISSFGTVTPNFNTAHDLAQAQATELLHTLGAAMIKNGAGDFWNRVKTEGVAQEAREKQFESYAHFSHAFLTAGADAPSNANGDYWMRVRLKTASEAGAGTNANIIARAGGKEFPLDWLPSPSGIANDYDDFEAGSIASYWLGPFDSPPGELEIANRVPPALNVVDATMKGLLTPLPLLAKGVEVLFSNPPDYIQTNSRNWTVSEIRSLNSTAQPFTIELNGGDEGVYKVHGTIAKTSESGDYAYCSVYLSELECVKESKIDGLTSEDEPFLFVALASVGGDLKTWRTQPFTGIDTGERCKLDALWTNVKVHKGLGELKIIAQGWESDDEKAAERAEMYRRFDGEEQKAFAEEQVKIGESIKTYGEIIGAEWKPEQMDVTVFGRGNFGSGSGTLKYGEVYNAPPNRWIKANESAKFPLSNNLRDTGITGDFLLTLAPKDPAPNLPPSPVAQDLSAWEGEWETTFGKLKLTRERSDLYTGTVMRTLDSGLVREGEKVEISYGAKPGQVFGKWNLGSGSNAISGTMEWTMAPDSNSFTGTIKHDKGVSTSTTPDPWNGKRVIGAGAPASKYDLTKWVGDWYTDTGKLTLKANVTGLQGTLYLPRRDQYSIEAGTFYLWAGDRMGHMKGSYSIDTGDGPRKSGTMELMMTSDGSAFLASLADAVNGSADPNRYEWVGSRAKRLNTGGDLTRWAGDWRYIGADWTFRMEGGALRGKVKGVNGETSRDLILLMPGVQPGSALGRYLVADTGARQAFLEWDLAGDSSRFTGTLVDSSAAPRVATGTRVGTPVAGGGTGNTGTVPGPSSPVVGGGSGGGSVPTPGGSVSVGDMLGDGQFRHLTDVDVRLDKLVSGRGGRVEATLTFKNTTAKSTRLMGGTMDLWLFDADGIGWAESGTVYRPGGTSLESAGILDFEPGDIVTVRYVWNEPGGLRALKQLRLQDRSQFEKAPILWDLQGFMPKGALASDLPHGLSTAGSGDFEELGDWDLRLDGVRRTNNQIELFLTYRNPAPTPRVFSGIRFILTDTDGSTASTTGQFYRATGDREQFKTSLVGAPNGGEGKFAYILTLPSRNAGPKKLTIISGESRLTYDLSRIP